MGAIQAIADQIRASAPQYVFLAARGTSDNAGRYASYLWGAFNRLPVALGDAIAIHILWNAAEIGRCAGIGGIPVGKIAGYRQRVGRGPAPGM